MSKYDEEHLTPNDPNAEYEYDVFGFIIPPFWIWDWRYSEFHIDPERW